jgi:hypothetical protein
MKRPKKCVPLCTTFGNYQYNRLPMGIKQSPDITQQIMNDLLRPYTETDVYIDDIEIFAQKSWDKHLTSIQGFKELHCQPFEM